MSQYAPLRDAFQELNKLLIDKQQWDAEHELRTSEMGLKKMQVESEMADREQQRIVREREVKDAQHAMQEVDVNIYDFVKNDAYNQKKLFDDSSAGEQFARVLAGENYSRIDRATGFIFDANGNKVKMPRMEVGSNAALANGVLVGAYDPEDMINNKVTMLDENINQLSSALKSVNPADVARRKVIKEQLAAAQNERNKHAANLAPEKLLPFYRNRMDIVDNLVVQAAASGARRDALTALQHVSSRVHADYNTLLAKQMAREDREFKLKIEQEKTKNENKSGLMKWAVKLGENGEILDTRAVNIPKEAGQSFSPAEVDPRLTGYTWTAEEHLKERGKTKEHQPNEETAFRFIKFNFGKNIVNPITGQEETIVPEANLPRTKAALSIYGVLRKDPEYKNMTEAAVAKVATNKAIQAEVKFWNDVDKIIMEQIINKNRLITEEAMKKVVNALAAKKDNTGTSFIDDFGYTPKFEYLPSLIEAAGANSIKIPQVGKSDEGWGLTKLLKEMAGNE